MNFYINSRRESKEEKLILHLYNSLLFGNSLENSADAALADSDCNEFYRPEFPICKNRVRNEKFKISASFEIHLKTMGFNATILIN